MTDKQQPEAIAVITHGLAVRIEQTLREASRQLGKRHAQVPASDCIQLAQALRAEVDQQKGILVISQRDELMDALKLALEYWNHRQKRYKNRSPAWVESARTAITKAEGEKQ